MTKQRMNDRIVKVQDYGFYGTIEELNKRINEALEKIPEQYRKEVLVTIEAESSYDDSTGLRFYLKYQSPETDREIEHRKQQEVSRERYEREQLVLLQKKYGK